MSVCKIQILKITFLVLLLVLLITNLAVNSSYNMTGYRGSHQIPGSSIVSTLVQHVKHYSSAKTSVKETGNRTLFLTKDLEKLILWENQKRVQSSGVNKSILFYNKPDWTNIDNVNAIFQKQCVYNNCNITSDLYDIQHHDAIIFSPHEVTPTTPPIKSSDRRPDQVWIMFGFESPANFEMGHRHNNWLNTINWTMSYRMNADIFFPYAFLKLNPDLPVHNYSAIFREKTRQAAWIVSHCNAESQRDEYVRQMEEAGLQVDVFGKCGRKPLQGTKLSSLVHSVYKFYLAFENSFCKDYITEKFFSYYTMDVIVVVRGGANYTRLLPEGTFIDAANFRSPLELVKYLQTVSESEALFTGYLQRKARYTVYGDISAMAYCSLCEKLNNLNNNRRTIDDHVTYMHKDVCWAPSDLPFQFRTHGFMIFYSIVFIVVVYIIYSYRRSKVTQPVPDM